MIGACAAAAQYGQDALRPPECSCTWACEAVTDDAELSIAIAGMALSAGAAPQTDVMPSDGMTARMTSDWTEANDRRTSARSAAVIVARSGRSRVTIGVLAYKSPSQTGLLHGAYAVPMQAYDFGHPTAATSAE